MRVPNVPTPFSERQVAPGEFSGGGFETQAPEEAFGGGPSAAQMAQKAEGAAGEASAYFQKHVEAANRVKIQDAELKLIKAKTPLMQKALNTHGEASFAMPEQVDKQFTESVKDISKGLVGNQQTQAFNSLVTNYRKDMFQTLGEHVARETHQLDLSTTSALVDNYQNEGIQNYKDPGKIQQSKDKIVKTLTDFGQRNGHPAEQVEANVRDSLSVMHGAVIGNMLADGNALQAKDYFDKNKPEISGNRWATLDKEIEHGTNIQMGVKAWNDYKGMRMADGMPDEGKIRSAIFAKPVMSDEQKESVWQFVKGRSNEDFRERTQKQAATERKFADTAIDAVKQGQPLESVLRMVPQFSQDSYDQSQKETFVHKLFEKPGESDPKAYMGLWEGVQEGKTTKGELDDAMSKGQINPKDWIGLSKEYFQANTEGKNPVAKANWDRIKEEATKQLGGDKDKITKFMYVLKTQSDGKDPDQVWKMANDELAKPKGWFQDQNYSVDYKKKAATDMAWGTAKDLLGNEAVNAIGAGYMRQGKKEFDLNDLDDFSRQLGGVGAIKPGTPAGNAIQSLMKAGQPVVPENVKAILAIAKDGNYTGAFK